MKIKIYCALVFLNFACFVHADTLEFKNGDRLTGKILKEESGKIFFHSDLLGDMEIDASRVSLITREDIPAVAEVEEQAATETEEIVAASTTRPAEIKKASKKSSLLRIPGFM